MENSKYRAEYRQKHIPGWYSGYIHFFTTFSLSLTLVIFAIFQLQDISAKEWMTIPLFFLLANCVEYFGHRYPMHHPMGFLKLLFIRHSKQHHIFFTDKHMQFDHSKDFKAVLFPIVLISFFFGLIGLPIWLVISMLFSANTAWLFVAVVIGYFLNYELLHFCYHLKEDSWVYNIPGFKRLRNLHLYHHDQKLMTKYNFNITYPICDILFKTYYRAEKK